MAEWLSSARKKKIHDIRSFIPVHGKILNPKSTSLSLESSSGVDYLVSETPGAWPQNSTSGGKQLSLVQISKKDAAANGMSQKVPASSLSTGIRRKTARTATTNETQEVFTAQRPRVDDKENFNTELYTHTSPLSSHREHWRSLTKTSTASPGKSKISDHEQCCASYSNQRHHARCDKCNECLTRDSHTGNQRSSVRASQASESTPKPSPPTKRLRTEHDHSSNRDSRWMVKNKSSRGRRVDITECLGSHHPHNEAEHILHEQARIRSEVQMVRTNSGITLQSAAESRMVATQKSADASASTLPVRDSQLGLRCDVNTIEGTTTDVTVAEFSPRTRPGNEASIADTHLASTRIEEGCSCLWGSEPVPISQGLFSCNTSNIIDTDELLAELSNCEKIV